MMIEICNLQGYINAPLIAFHFCHVFNQETLRQHTVFDLSLRLLNDTED